MGTVPVGVRVEDDRGGLAEQHYVLSVSEAPPNRPPHFTSLPVVHAIAGQSYVYQVEVDDPDGDPLAFSFPLAYTETVLADEPIAYWRLGELSGDKAVNLGTLGSQLMVLIRTADPSRQWFGGGRSGCGNYLSRL